MDKNKDKKISLRCLTIVETLSVKPSSFEEINQVLEEKEFNSISERTFIRDKGDIFFHLGIEIAYDRKNNLYFINNEGEDKLLQRRLDAFRTQEVFRSLDKKDNFIHLDNRNSNNSISNLKPLVNIIRKGQTVSFQYQSFESSESFQTEVIPHFLKEFEGRWYVFTTSLDEQPKQRHKPKPLN